MIKTNVMRILDSKKIKYKIHTYKMDSPLSAVEVAKAINEDENKIFKTLVTIGKSGENYVFVISGNKELDLKKAANVASEKSISMLKSKDLLNLTGYIHGGCSPIGMKKTFKTFLSLEALEKTSIIISAGKIGFQIEIAPETLKKCIDFEYVDVTI